MASHKEGQSRYGSLSRRPVTSVLLLPLSGYSKQLKRTENISGQLRQVFDNVIISDNLCYDTLTCTTVSYNSTAYIVPAHA